MNKKYKVNVWFGAEPAAKVTEEFDHFRGAKAFAALYAEYPDVTIRIFRPGEEYHGVDPRDL